METGGAATAASTTGSSTDISARATIAARRVDLVALTAGRAPRATREVRERDMAIVVEVFGVGGVRVCAWKCLLRIA